MGGIVCCLGAGSPAMAAERAEANEAFDILFSQLDRRIVK
jgi:hypothetical protein